MKSVAYRVPNALDSNLNIMKVFQEPCPICQNLEKPLDNVMYILEKLALTSHQNTEEWLEKRSQMFTASDIPTLLCKNFFKTPNEVLEEKVYGRTFFGNEATEWGSKFEDEACNEFQTRTGHKVAHTGLLIHPNIPWLGGSPDGITWCGLLLEIKCPFSAAIPKDPQSVPKQYQDQLNTLLCITGLPGAMFVRYRPPGYDKKGIENPGKKSEYACVYWGNNENWLNNNYQTLLQQQNKLKKMKYFQDLSIDDATAMFVSEEDNVYMDYSDPPMLTE
jgi:putative phage-type endonuclease